MNSKSTIWIFMTIGSMVGSYIPLLWGDGFFSFASVICTAIGGFVGIWIGFKISS